MKGQSGKCLENGEEEVGIWCKSERDAETRSCKAYSLQQGA